MIAKVIAHGATRDEALDRLGQALAGTVVAGPRTNVTFLKALTEAEGFRAGRFRHGVHRPECRGARAVPQPMDARAARRVLPLIQAVLEREDVVLTPRRSGAWSPLTRTAIR